MIKSTLLRSFATSLSSFVLLLMTLNGTAVSLDAKYYDASNILEALKSWNLVASRYQPDATILTEIQRERPLFFQVYYGPWCPDSTREIPRLLTIAQSVGARVQLIPLDRNKVPVRHPDYPINQSTATFAVGRTPTIFVWRRGQPVGTLVERLHPTPEEALLTLLRKTD